MKFIRHHIWLVPFLFLIVFSNCSKDPAQPQYEKQITVFGYLWGNEYLGKDHSIMLAWTQPLFEKYDVRKAAIQGALVKLTAESTQKEVTLIESSEKPGYYFNDTLFIVAGESYHLQIQVGEKTLTASTRVPDLVTLTTSLQDDTVTIDYPESISNNHPIFIAGPNPEQIIMVDVYCLENYTNAKYIDPFGDKDYPADQEEYDQNRNGEPRHIIALAKLKEFKSANYPGRLVTDWYSSMIVFYGNYRLQCLAIDDNYHKFLYTENPLYESGIEGGLGVFGSMTGKTYFLKIIEH